MQTAVLSLLSLLSQPDAVTTASPPATSALYRKIEACRAKLELEAPVSARITGEDALLCVSHSDADTVTTVRVVGGISRTPGFTVQLINRNGVNSQYRVIRPESYSVVALKTNVSAGTLRLKAMKTFRDRNGRRVRKPVTVLKSRARAVVYVPFSTEHDRALIRYGFKYLLKKVDEAKEAMTERAVVSRVPRADPDVDWLVTETVAEMTVMTLLGVEHMDPTWTAPHEEWKTLTLAELAVRRKAELRKAVERVLITIALNGEDAYDYAGSRAAAYGFAQFIKPTYDRIRHAYPEAKLLPDFGEGMRDHTNAIIAQYCLADWSLKALAPEARVRLMDGTREEDLGAYLAAAYNGGEDLAANAYAHDPKGWDGLRPDLEMPKRRRGRKAKTARQLLFEKHWIPRDTMTYVREFRLVYRFLFVDEQVEPSGP